MALGISPPMTSKTPAPGKESLASLDAKKLRILSLSSEYPNPSETGKALFIQARLKAISQIAPVTVVAPVAVLDYANPHGRLFGSRGIPYLRKDDNVRVFHPRWIYPPRCGALNTLFLSLRLLPLVRRLIKQGRCNLIDAHFLHPEGVTAALVGAAMRVPFVVTVRGSEFLHRR